jgi:assimilatory nitrate reductase catalytic subunit
MQFTPEDIERVGRFWNAPAMVAREGRQAVAMFDAIARGEIKGLWVMATNPAVSLPTRAVCAKRSPDSSCSWSPKTFSQTTR